MVRSMIAALDRTRPSTDPITGVFTGVATVMVAMNPFFALRQGAAAAQALGLKELNTELLRTVIFSHPSSKIWAEEEKWNRVNSEDKPPLIDPGKNPFICLEVTRRSAMQRQTPETDLDVDKLLEVIDNLWLALRSHPQSPIWARGLVAFERAAVSAERAKPGSVIGIDPQFVGGETDTENSGEAA
jgi:hypothetical protein